jgi:hypothetical protein
MRQLHLMTSTCTCRRRFRCCCQLLPASALSLLQLLQHLLKLLLTAAGSTMQMAASS